jgi:tetratricopeptide (TPR) repeat protein
MRWKRWLVLLAWLLAWAGVAGADGPMSPTAAEQDALLAIESKKYVRLRELAQKMLSDPATKELYTTFYFMGYVLHHAEGDLPRSHWYLDQAMAKFDQKYGNPPSYSAPWGWMEKIILEQAMVTGEMDLYEEQIKTWDRLDKLWSHYGRHLAAIQAFYSWPLMKLGREQEAREKLRQALRDGESEFAVTQVLNSLGALEMETDHLQAGARAFGKLLESVDRNGWQMTVTYYRNAGEAAACLLQFDEAERLFLKSTEYFDPDAFSNPWWDLATLYLSQGRYAEAVSALKKCHKWTYQSEPFLAQQTWAANQQLTCEILLQLGMTEQAFKIAQGFVERPDRKGGDSVQRDQWAAANMIIFREAANARRHAIQEQMVWTRGKAWWKLLWQQRDLAWQAYLKGQQAAASLVSHGRLLTCLRYTYAPGTVLIPNYVRLELPTLLGPGTTLAALDQLESKRFETLELERPYLNAIRFEALARAGRRQEALTRLEPILKELPTSEVLMRTRVVARAAKLYLQAGDMTRALPLIQEVMEKSPCFMRNLQIALPVSYSSDGSDIAEKVIGMCRRSPRFSEAEGAFQVEVNKSSARLLGPDKSVLSQAEMEPLKKGEEAAPKLAEALHDRFFAAPIDLSQLDVGSLDGVVTGAVQSKEMQEMFFPGSTKPTDTP